MHLQHLTNTDLAQAPDAAEYLLGPGARPGPLLQVKPGTFRADVTAAIEDREPATLEQP